MQVKIVASKPRTEQDGINHLIGNVYLAAPTDDDPPRYSVNEPAFGGQILLNADEIEIISDNHPRQYMQTHATYMPLGSVKAHHMPDSWYDEWERLYKAERRAYRTGRGWRNVSQRLLAHEKTHNTK